MQHGSEFISQLTSVKEPAKFMELQSEYARNSYETFVAEAKRISELYADLFKHTTKPLEDLDAVQQFEAAIEMELKQLNSVHFLGEDHLDLPK